MQPVINSGLVLFDSAVGGSTSVLPVSRPQWLNDKILEIDADIKALEASGVKPGKDGHEVAIKVGMFPETVTPPEIQRVAILWSIVPRDETEIQVWKPLIFKDELIGPSGKPGVPGPQGPKGIPGKDGTSVKFHGSVQHIWDLIKYPSVKGDAVYVEELGTLYMLIEEPYTDGTLWRELGKIQGPVGPKGDRGPVGPTGPQGPAGSGGVGQFILQWVVDSATSAVMSAVTATIASQVSAAIDALTGQMASIAEQAAGDAVQSALQEAYDSLKGDKGEKGDKGDKGEDGKSVRLVGKFETKAQFMAKYPLYRDNVGVAGLIGKKDESKELWAITQDSSGVTPYPPVYSNLGDIRGPKGDDANWTISVRNTGFVEKARLVVDSSLEQPLSSMYIRDSDSVVVEGLNGSELSPDHVGFKISMRYPIPKLAVENDPSGKPSTVGKILSNDGTKLTWVDAPKAKEASDKILIKGADNNTWALTIDNNGRMHQSIVPDETDIQSYQIKAPSGGKFIITVDDNGQLTTAHA